MVRYIDAEKVIEIAESNKAVLQSLGDIVDIREIVNDVPTADVQPVIHAKWILTGDEQLDNVYFGNKCSECKFVYCGDFLNYCPNCGAKMDKE